MWLCSRWLCLCMQSLAGSTCILVEGLQDDGSCACGRKAHTWGIQVAGVVRMTSYGVCLHTNPYLTSLNKPDPRTQNFTGLPHLP